MLKYSLSASLSFWNIVFRFLGCCPIIFNSLSDNGSILGLLPFSGVIFTNFLSKSMSVHVNWVSSPILMPVSFSV